ncbi:hypothetical protein ABT127_30730 [Streptomyces sp. NPDC001904]|uniref:hypothetical protein n=1 Tax=Streptomyces sp. NPDC001904 TaxID=3154531 RepID=UPI003317BB12
MLRRNAITVLFLLSATACTSVEAGSSGTETPDASTTPTATARPADKGIRTSAWVRNQVHGKEKKLLLPVVSGSQETTLGPFSPSSGAYTVIAECKGDGSVSIDTDPAEKPEKVRCGVSTVGLVFVETGKPQTMTVTPSEGVGTWTIAVLDGRHSA